MSDFLSREVRAELDAARRLGLKKRSRLRIVAGGETHAVLRMLADGFTLDAADIVHLRGIVDLYDGARHVSQCLIVASDIEGGELVCTLKWATAVRQAAALDYVRDDHAPVGYLPQA